MEWGGREEMWGQSTYSLSGRGKRARSAYQEKNPERWEDKQEEGCSRIGRKEFKGEVVIE